MSMAIDLLESIGRLDKAICDEVDWFIARIQEKDTRKRELYETIWLKKQAELGNIAKEEYERHK